MNHCSFEGFGGTFFVLFCFVLDYILGLKIQHTLDIMFFNLKVIKLYAEKWYCPF